jgi:hypothetical protein
MKTVVLLSISFCITLGPLVKAEDQDKVKDPKSRSKGPQNTHQVVPAGPRFNPNKVQANQYDPKVQSPARVYPNRMTPKADVPRMTPRVQADTSAWNKNWQKKEWQKNNNQNTTEQNRDWQNRNWQDTNNPKITAQRRNWQNQNWNNQNWAEARRRRPREHHDRFWWRSHFTRFALFGTGYYFWDGGYWYPAYGYDPAYNTYAYDEPIYGSSDLDPGQVIANVQTELQRLGYYRYAVDGQMGPATRAAIARYQRDNGLAATAAIDEPTLQSLGLD